MRDFDLQDLQGAARALVKGLAELERRDTSEHFKLGYAESVMRQALEAIEPIVKFEQENNQ